MIVYPFVSLLAFSIDSKLSIGSIRAEYIVPEKIEGVFGQSVCVAVSLSVT